MALAVIEPNFTGPPAALLFSIAAAGTALSADHANVGPLWAAYFIFAGSIAISSIAALTLPDGRAQASAKWLSTRFGRPVWLGLSALVIEMVRLASTNSTDKAVWLACGVLLAIVIAAPSWFQVFLLAGSPPESVATVTTAVEPNLVLLATSMKLVAGQGVELRGKGSAGGVVLGNLAHKSGNRIQVALGQPWYDIVDSSGEVCSVEGRDQSGDRPLAVVLEGSTERSLRMKPFSRISPGDTFYVHGAEEGEQHLYQVTSLELIRDSWDGSSVIEQRATATMLGTVEGGALNFKPALPTPHALVFRAAQVTAALATGYQRIGTVAGTSIPFGLSVDQLRGHHLAVLGMSGMGKSTISRTIIQLLETDSVVVAVDGTGEYRTRFNISPWDNAVGLISPGSWVYEPQGVPALRAAEFIETVMNTAAQEYLAASPPTYRTLVFEEAHSFLPEWNFTAVRSESDHVARSCRYILQARKFGISFVLVSQRTAVINKSALSQCESYIVFRTLDETSLQYVEGVLGSEFRRTIPGLGRYQAACVGPAFSTQAPTVVDLDPPG